LGNLKEDHTLTCILRNVGTCSGWLSKNPQRNEPVMESATINTVAPRE
jgi:hypothetical protein